MNMGYKKDIQDGIHAFVVLVVSTLSFILFELLSLISGFFDVLAVLSLLGILCSLIMFIFMTGLVLYQKYIENRQGYIGDLYKSYLDWVDNVSKKLE